MPAPTLANAPVRVEILLGAWAAVMIATVHHRKTPWDSIFDTKAADYSVDPDVLKAIATWEHRDTKNLGVPALDPSDANVVSRPNANGSQDYGVMQVNLSTWGKFLDVDASTILDPEVNIDSGAAIVRELTDELKDRASLFNIMAAYNEGAPRVYKDGPVISAGYAEGVFWHFVHFKAARIVYLNGALA